MKLKRRISGACWLAISACTCPAALAFEFVDVSDTNGFSAGLAADIPAGGIAVADFDRNGYPDIFVTGYALPNRLLFNRGDGTFEQDPSVNAGLAGDGCSVAAAADYDNDGWPDLYVGCRNGSNLLLRNESGQGFSNLISAEVDHLTDGLLPIRTDAVAWGDLDGNGLPDLFIGIYPESGNPDLDNPLNLDRIVLNHGGGVWQQVSSSLPREPRSRTTLAATISDLNRDGLPDLYIVNEKLDGNNLWLNLGEGCGGWCFSDVAVASGAERPSFGMGIAVGDVDRDGLADLFFSSINEQVLLRGVASEPLQFEQWQQPAGLDHPAVGWATILADFNHDGWEDAFLAVAAPGMDGENRHDQCFVALGDGAFENISAACGLAVDRTTMAAALIDFDRDGRLDLVLGHFDQGYRLYRNVTETADRWIGFALEGGAPGVSRDALGARVEVETGDGVQWRELRAGESRGSSHDRILHFGLGANDRARVTIHWPDGLVSGYGQMAAGRYYSIAHPSVDVLFGADFEQSPP